MLQPPLGMPEPVPSLHVNVTVIAVPPTVEVPALAVIPGDCLSIMNGPADTPPETQLPAKSHAAGVGVVVVKAAELEAPEATLVDTLTISDELPWIPLTAAPKPDP